mmetsp:Transcript_65685/g.177416  ORF Transcript_65685/g.177416 Transcript_65685/m.177416 type:complete len:273 (+) Transcript_65685:830-1648(+)
MSERHPHAGAREAGVVVHGRDLSPHLAGRGAEHDPRDGQELLPRSAHEGVPVDLHGRRELHDPRPVGRPLDDLLVHDRLAIRVEAQVFDAGLVTRGPALHLQDLKLQEHELLPLPLGARPLAGLEHGGHRQGGVGPEGGGARGRLAPGAVARPRPGTAQRRSRSHRPRQRLCRRPRQRARRGPLEGRLAGAGREAQDVLAGAGRERRIPLVRGAVGRRPRRRGRRPGHLRVLPEVVALVHKELRVALAAHVAVVPLGPFRLGAGEGRQDDPR